MKFINLSKENFSIYKDDLQIEVADTYRISFENQMFNEGYFESLINNLYQYICDDKAYCIVCEDDRLVGHIWCHEEIVLGEKKWCIDNFYLDSEYRNMGIGTELLNRALEIGRTKGLHLCELMVTSKNIGAINFYKQKGFNVTRHKMEMEF